MTGRPCVAEGLLLGRAGRALAVLVRAGVAALLAATLALGLGLVAARAALRPQWSSAQYQRHHQDVQCFHVCSFLWLVCCQSVSGSQLVAG